MSITWSHSLEGIDWLELEALYRATPLGNKSASGLEIVFTNSRYVCFALEAGRIVGAGRALADGADCSYICDIAVLPSHQGTGVGKEIVAKLLALSKGRNKKIILYAVPGKEPSTGGSGSGACSPQWQSSRTRNKRLSEATSAKPDHSIERAASFGRLSLPGAAARVER